MLTNEGVAEQTKIATLFNFVLKGTTIEQSEFVQLIPT